MTSTSYPANVPTFAPSTSIETLRATVEGIKSGIQILKDEFQSWENARIAQQKADAPLNLNSMTDAEFRLWRSGDDCLIRLNAEYKELNLAKQALADAEFKVSQGAIRDQEVGL